MMASDSADKRLFDNAEHAELLNRLHDTVAALTELNYPGAEFEELVDDLDQACAEYQRFLVDATH
jgi:hypothetical protein